jgi:thiol:disulfide interchange protein
MRSFFHTILFISSFLLLPLSSHAQTVYDAHTHVEFIQPHQSIIPGEAFWIGLHMKMDPGWHVYWRNPGDSGLPPKIKWEWTEGFSGGDIQWPYPERINAGDLTAYGYANEVIFPIEVMPPSQLTETQVTLKARVDWLACEGPCIPGKGDFLIVLPVGEKQSTDPAGQKLIEKAIQNLPQPFPDITLKAWQSADNFQIHFISPRQETIESIQFFPFDENLIVHSAQQQWSMNSDKKVTLSLVKNKRNGNVLVSRIDGVIEIKFQNLENVQAFQISVPVQEDLPFSEKSSESLMVILLMFFFSFLGGLILNLMPCVFPVLSIKVLAFIQHAHNRRSLYLSALGYSLGVVAAFASLAVVLIILKESGQYFGWGFQFQSPYFVTGIALLLFLIALNLFGLFEWHLPLSGTFKNEGGWSESFMTGILAVIVATPCTAPFMGTALSFALTQSPLVNILIFVFLGIGLAFPFVLLCFFPSLIRILPKPGKWMDDFKKCLSFPMLATVIWLLWVLAGQKGSWAIIAVLIGMLCIGFGLWLRTVSLSKKPLIHILAIAVICLGVALPFKIIGSLEENKEVSLSQEEWLPYDESLIAQKEKEGKIIFIDFTARWCLTCQVNERIALNHPDVKKAFKEKGILTFKADWTNQDEKITKALADFGKNSVPVYVFIYEEEGQRKVVLLPEILTPKLVMEFINKINH